MTPPVQPHRHVLVAGAAVSGVAAAEALLRLGAEVTVTDRAESARTEALAALGARVALDLAAPPEGVSLVVTSPGWRPDHPLFAAAASAGVEVIGEVELAYRLADTARTPWLGVTGTNGKTTTVGMLESILRAAGCRTVAAGNVGLPLIQAVTAPPGGEPYDVLAVELSSFQLHWTSTVECLDAAVLNVAEDHVDWHGSMAAYAADKARIWRGNLCSVYNAEDGWCRRLVADHVRSYPDDGDAHGFGLGPPDGGDFGVVDGKLVDAAYGIDPDADEWPGRGTVLADVADIPLPGPHNVANALAAAALARAYGNSGRAGRRIGAAAVREGLRSFPAGHHRNELVHTAGGVAYVDDSKATNPHAATASLSAYDRVVWIAGGLLKGATVDELVRAVRPRLAGVVLLGRDRHVISASIARHAPDVPVAEVARTDDGAMAEVVRAAAALAAPGDTVLLAPAAASMDMFRDYAARGDAFASAARQLGRQ